MADTTLTPIMFSEGETARTIYGTVDTTPVQYFVEGKKGSTLNLHVADHNGAVSVGSIRATLAYAESITSETSAITPEGETITSWWGEFPIDGVVIITVLQQRGPAPFALTVVI